MPSEPAFGVRREVRFYEPVTTAWYIAKSRQFYGITVTSSCSKGSSYQRSSGGSQAAPSACAESSAIPWAPTPAVLQWERYDTGTWDGSPAKDLSSSVGGRCVVSPSRWPGGRVCLTLPYLWLLFSSTFALRRPIDVSGFPYPRGTYRAPEVNGLVPCYPGSPRHNQKGTTQHSCRTLESVLVTARGLQVPMCH